MACCAQLFFLLFGVPSVETFLSAVFIFSDWTKTCHCSWVLNIATWWCHQMETFVRGIHRSPVNSPHKGQWRGALMFSYICAWINGWVNIGEASNLRHHRTHYDVTVMNPCYWKRGHGIVMEINSKFKICFNWKCKYTRSKMMDW